MLVDTMYQPGIVVRHANRMLAEETIPLLCSYLHVTLLG